MQPFAYSRADDIRSAVGAVSGAPGHHIAPTSAPAQFIAGGTTMLDLMKLDVMRPRALIDINGLAAEYGTIAVEAEGLRLGAFVRMSSAAEHPALLSDYPVIAQTLQMAASPQLRHMASLGGNVLQRTRCSYFRDTAWTACNKRLPGSGCAALDGVNRKHAILGVSDKCIASYPGDFAQALVALDATIETIGPGGKRSLPFERLHTGSAAPEIETVLVPGEIITGFMVPAGPWTKRSAYVKVRDRQSYEFALTSAAVALDLEGDTVREARVGLGGVAYRPWRAHAVEAALKGKPLNPDTAAAAAREGFADATAREHNRFKIELGQRTLMRALLQAQAMSV
jgi:xanthine dehydrogenase YagS FAD-binding subunit